MGKKEGMVGAGEGTVGREPISLSNVVSLSEFVAGCCGIKHFFETVIPKPL